MTTKYTESGLALPYPEYTDPAAGPDQIKALADAVDLKMTRLRSSYPIPGYGADFVGNDFAGVKGNTVVIYSTTPTLVAFGWAEITVGCSLVMVNDSTFGSQSRAWAGWLRILVNNVVVRQRYIHSFSALAHGILSVTAKIPLPLTTETFAVSATWTNDLGSADQVNVRNVECQILQFGAPRP